MIIGIDISQIVYGTGVSVYTQKLVEKLIKIDSENKYLLFAASLRQKKFFSSYYATLCCNDPKVKLKLFPFPPMLLDFLWNRVHFLPIENLIGRVDVFHSSDWTQPPVKGFKVSTVHDLSFIHYPHSFPKKIINVHKRRLSWVKKEVDIVIADSKATKKDLVKLLGFEEGKIRVVYLGINKTQKSKIKTQDMIKILKRKFKISDKYLLYIGTLEPRKNLVRLIEAFYSALKQYNNPKINLVISGKKGWMYTEIFNKVKQLGLEQKAIFTDYISEDEKTVLLQNAKCFVYPSLYEGFGLPVLEAMAAGCPVITSNISSLPEVAGQAALLVDPTNVAEIGKAIKLILSNNSFANKLREKGLMQARNFSWEKTAKNTLEIYKELDGRN